ncbi:MAG: hypothetical protein CL607_09680 [Anaerolineaceae bacterium]|nr:hypothetical protein [Anaerolineaceae bacterium]
MPKVELDLTPSKTDIQTIRSGLVTYNLKHAPILPELPRGDVAIIARGPHKRIIGGAIGEVDWGWLYVDTLWVEASQRKRGLGWQLMLAIEQYALQQTISHCYLMTTSFQAREFYEKLGYKVIGHNDDRPRRHTMYYLEKTILPVSGLPAFEVQTPPHAHVVQQMNDVFIEETTETVPLVNQKLAVFLRDDEGNVRGGLYGNVFWDWFDLRYLWIDEAYRGQGYTRQLFDVAEAELRERQAVGIVTDTADFQAPDVYKKLGFEVFATLADRPPGHTSYLIQKYLG